MSECDWPSLHTASHVVGEGVDGNRGPSLFLSKTPHMPLDSLLRYRLTAMITVWACSWGHFSVYSAWSRDYASKISSAIKGEGQLPPSEIHFSEKDNSHNQKTTSEKDNSSKPTLVFLDVLSVPPLLRNSGSSN
jgi:hypothetical protein